ncbi:hypothetical protein X777_03101 [Ooceraea biroi]|uniref:Uncharacterized protein n=1 Tax=Ooceraea biroi TaxID=2015173 RepID=A0A026WKC2_OOCBI|nr:hypothetical protein X777_03101 [Ooceraea biroi]
MVFIAISAPERLTFELHRGGCVLIIHAPCQGGVVAEFHVSDRYNLTSHFYILSTIRHSLLGTNGPIKKNPANRNWNGKGCNYVLAGVSAFTTERNNVAYWILLSSFRATITKDHRRTQ